MPNKASLPKGTVSTGTQIKRLVKSIRTFVQDELAGEDGTLPEEVAANFDALARLLKNTDFREMRQDPSKRTKTPGKKKPVK